MATNKLVVEVSGVKQVEEVIDKIIKELPLFAPRERALVFGLIGELGAGKTTFVQIFLRKMQMAEVAASPSFVLMRSYALMNGFQIYHIDAWRIVGDDLLALGIKSLFSQPRNIIFVEWADKVKKILPADTVWIRFKHLGRNKRKISVVKKRSWSASVLQKHPKSF